MDDIHQQQQRDFRDEAAQCRRQAGGACEPRRSHLLNLASHYDVEAEDQELRARFQVLPRL